MSSTLTTLVPVFDGTNLPSWAPKMKACLRSVGLGYVLRTARPSEAAADAETATPSATTGTGTQAGGSAAGGTQAGETTSSSAAALDWDKDDEKAMGMIRLRVTESIGQMLDTKTSAKEMWNALEAQYGRKGLGGAINEFTDAIRIKIPGNQDPSGAIDTISMHFARLAAMKVVVPDHLIGMIVLSKLPGRYEVVKQIYAQSDIEEIQKIKVDDIKAKAINAFNGTGKSSDDSGPKANKLTNIRRKQNDPQFSQQQRGSNNQQRQQGSNNGNGDGNAQGNKRKRHHRSKKNKGQNGQGNSGNTAQQNGGNNLAFSPVSDPFVFEAPRVDFDPSTPDVRRHSRLPAHRPSTTSLRIHKKTKKGIERAHTLGVAATPEVIRALEPSGHISEIESDDEDDVGPSQKRVRTLADRITLTPDAENGITAATPPPPSPIGFEDFGMLPPSPAFPATFDTPVSLGDPDEMMNLDLDLEIADIAGILENMGETGM